MGKTQFGTHSIIKKMFGTKEVVKEVCNGVVVYEKNTVKPYVTFSSPSTFTIRVNAQRKYWDGTLQYSTDKTTWSTWNGSSTLSSASDGTKYNIYIRGIGNTRLNVKLSGVDGQHYGCWVMTGSNISIIGNIENLLDYTTVALGNHPPMADYCFNYLFYNQTAITDISNLELPATTLSQYCYYTMFRNCSITTTPKLPATTLAAYCYYYMFYSCTSLVTIPSLPATTLTAYCYATMFRGCTSIKLSTTQTGEYQTPYRIPTSGTGTTASNAMSNMFYQTGGTFTGTPTINTTYYTSNTVIPAN